MDEKPPYECVLGDLEPKIKKTESGLESCLKGKQGVKHV